VNQEVHDAGVLRLRGRHFLQDARALELLNVGQIVAVGSDLQPVRIQNRRLNILGIAGMELLQSLLICHCARLEWNRRMIFEDGLDAGNLVALARRLAAELFRFFDSGPAFLLLFAVGGAPSGLSRLATALAQYAIAHEGSASRTAATAESTFSQ
jgi:hypothetical protein